LIMNRVNGVYERDLAIHMNIVANNNLIIYAGDNMCAGVACTSANDPYTNNNGGTMLTENTNNLNSVIDTANFDIGHVFSTGGGGVATLNGPCGPIQSAMLLRLITSHTKWDINGAQIILLTVRSVIVQAATGAAHQRMNRAAA
jgi:Metallo-peptidase family M12B Reprolysin-like